MFLYRVTFTDTLSKQWWERQSNPRAPVTRRVYRWGTYWGILALGGSSWTAERRESIAETPTYVLESLQRHPTLTPPVHIDDIWEEECVNIDEVAEYNGLLSIAGSPTEIRAWCLKHEMPVPTELPAAASQPRFGR